MPAIPSGTAPWHLVFSTDFNGPSLPSDQWSTGAWAQQGITYPNNNLEQACYDPNQVSLDGSSLVLTAAAGGEACDGARMPYRTGSVTTYGKFSFTYGYFEARVWLPGSNTVNDWPAFWAVGAPYTDALGEIDVVEGINGQACATFHQTNGNGDSHCVPGNNYLGGWHTFGADWEPGSITFYYDGFAISEVTNGVTSAPMFLTIDLGVSSLINPRLTIPATMRVAYVRVWQH